MLFRRPYKIDKVGASLVALVKNPPASAEDTGSIPDPRKIPEREKKVENVKYFFKNEVESEWSTGHAANIVHLCTLKCKDDCISVLFHCNYGILYFSVQALILLIMVLMV